MSIFVFTFRYTIPILCKKCIKIPTSISIERHYLSAIILISHSLFKNIEVQIFKSWFCGCVLAVCRRVIGHDADYYAVVVVTEI